MDFANDNIKKLHPRYTNDFEIVNQIPKKNLSELEQLNAQIFTSIKTRMQNIPNENTSQTFKKMVNQMRGQDVSIVSNLTKDFIKTTRKDYN